DIAVIRLPRLSKFTDFNILGRERGVNLRYVDAPKDLGSPDLIILPGTKSTINDLLYIKENGLAGAVVSQARTGTMVMGICGGFQMLGRSLRDENHVESNQSFTEGLGLLDTDTTFLSHKQTFQVKAMMEKGPLPFYVDDVLTGYEIHMGASRSSAQPLLRIVERSGSPVEVMDGAVSPKGQVVGTYLHGLFDNDTFRLQLLNYLRRQKGRAPLEKENTLSSLASKEETYNRLAEAVRKNLRMDLIYKTLGLHEAR
ncbi:MAG: cobyric acid synthase CobQ, partial [Candidatus Brocadiales bacterium]|nr:cobyric acid synthase CobQ [Candidatus Brocadiales bacterium]